MARIAILACIGVMLAVTLLPTLRSYLRQQGQIASLQEQVREQTGTVEALLRERRQWNDPAYVEQQARDRLKFVRPGEKSYSVIDAPAAVGSGDPASATGRAATWYDRVWESMVLAEPPATAPK
ncbi:MAG TPA: septum formation initiator family protein [Dermatophilaceae bacterium]|nr:septum formation initiator family protein [Dermatophilaceae bacterium]